MQAVDRIENKVSINFDPIFLNPVLILMWLGYIWTSVNFEKPTIYTQGTPIIITGNFICTK